MVAHQGVRRLSKPLAAEAGAGERFPRRADRDRLRSDLASPFASVLCY